MTYTEADLRAAFFVGVALGATAFLMFLGFLSLIDILFFSRRRK